MTIDVQFRNEGTIWLMIPVSHAAHDWVDEHIAPDAMRFGSAGIVIEHRYVADIAQGMADDGLQIEEI